MAAVLAVGLTGVVGPTAVFAGFGDPTVVTIAFLFVLSAGLERTGVAVLVARRILRATGSSEVALVVTLMALCGVLSGFMNNIGAMAMLIPVALAVCRETGISPSRLLMPLAIASRLGGALTLIAGPSNLIVSGLLAGAGYPPLRFFSFLPVGTALLVVGIAFMASLGRKLLPTRMLEGFLPSGAPRRALQETYKLPERLFRIRVDERSMLAGKTIAETSLGRLFGINVLTIVRGKQRIPAPAPGERLQPGDALLVEARPEDAERIKDLGPVEVAHDRGEADDELETDKIGLVEVVLAPRSDLAGKSLKELEFRRRFALNVVAIWRKGEPRRTWLADLPLEYGDALLVQGSRERIRLLRQNPNFIALDKPLTPRTSRRAIALLAAGTLVVLGAFGIVPVSIAAMLAAGIVVLGGCLTAEESLQAVDWPTVVVTAGLLPLGAVLQTTGTATAIAGLVVSLSGNVPLVTLIAVFLTTVTIGHFVPSVPTTILMAPIAIGVAKTLGVNPIPYMMVISSASSVTLLTPVSHPVSLMVMGPGGYRFGDYTRVGGPLAVLLGATLLAVVAVVWPL